MGDPRKALQQMKQLGLLEVVSEMIRSSKPFSAYMANQLRTNRRVPLLLDLMDMGVPATTPLSFLDRAGQQRVREVTMPMTEREAADFVNLLIKPPVDNRRIIEELGLPGPERRLILPMARDLILKNPPLAADGRRLTEEVLRAWPR